MKGRDTFVCMQIFRKAAQSKIHIPLLRNQLLQCRDMLALTCKMAEAFDT